MQKSPESIALIWERDEPGTEVRVTYRYVCVPPAAQGRAGSPGPPGCARRTPAPDTSPGCSQERARPRGAGLAFLSTASELSDCTAVGGPWTLGTSMTGVQAMGGSRHSTACVQFCGGASPEGQGTRLGLRKFSGPRKGEHKQLMTCALEDMDQPTEPLPRWLMRAGR